jgi:hypothetical protein
MRLTPHTGPIPKTPKAAKDRKQLRAQPRAKGNRAEREVIDILRARGYAARRNFQSGGQGGGDILGGPEGFHLEVKHRERCSIWEWIAQAEAERSPTQTPLVIHRVNGRNFHAVLPRIDLTSLMVFAGARHSYRVVRESGRVKLWEWIAVAEAEAPVVALSAIPIVDFARPGADSAGWYSDLPFDTLLDLIAEAAA